MPRIILDDITIEGVSMAGEATNLRLPEWNLMFDIGACSIEASAIDTLLITHGHPDHCGAIANYLFLRKIRGLSPPKVMAPPSLIPMLEAIVQSFADIHKSHYPAQFIALPPFDVVPLGSALSLRAIPAPHTVETYAYLLYREGESDSRAFLAFSGDTDVTLLDRDPDFYHARTLLFEATFSGNDCPVEEAHTHHHTHLDELYERAGAFQNDHIVIVHRMRQFSDEFVRYDLRHRSPVPFREKAHVFPGEPNS